MVAGCVRSWVVCGVPGSGKSILGRGLARARGAVLLDQDVLTGPLTGVVARLVGAEPDDLDDPRVRAVVGDAAYDALVDTALDNLAGGREVVMVAPFTALLDPDRAARLIARLGDVELRVVWSTCPPEALLERLRGRGAGRDRRKLVDPAPLLARLELPPAIPHVAVDTTAPLPTQLAAALTAPAVAP